MMLKNSRLQMNPQTIFQEESNRTCTNRHKQIVRIR